LLPADPHTLTLHDRISFQDGQEQACLHGRFGRMSRPRPARPMLAAHDAADRNTRSGRRPPQEGPPMPPHRNLALLRTTTLYCVIAAAFRSYRLPLRVNAAERARAGDPGMTASR